MTTVLVSGCYDLLHAGHIAFFREAASYGKLYVSVGSDANIELLKGKRPVFSEAERLFIVKSIRHVEDAFIGSGAGMLDFEPDLRRLKPDFLVVNEDGHTEEKRLLCARLGVTYKILKRVPEAGLPARASSTLKNEIRFPYRIALAGGWIDQPWVSRIHPGSMVVASLIPDRGYAERSGMATSSRRRAIEIWGDRLPEGDPVVLAKALFGAENPPGTPYVSGSQDQIGLLVPGISRLSYAGDYWPKRITTTRDPGTAAWLESVLHLVPLRPRPRGYDPLKIKRLSPDFVARLGASGEKCWRAILRHDLGRLGESLSESLDAWAHLLPLTVPASARQALRRFDGCAGATLSGAGGGYVIAASDKPVSGAVRIKIRL